MIFLEVLSSNTEWFALICFRILSNWASELAWSKWTGNILNWANLWNGDVENALIKRDCQPYFLGLDCSVPVKRKPKIRKKIFQDCCHLIFIMFICKLLINKLIHIYILPYGILEEYFFKILANREMKRNQILCCFTYGNPLKCMYWPIHVFILKTLVIELPSGFQVRETLRKTVLFSSYFAKGEVWVWMNTFERYCDSINKPIQIAKNGYIVLRLSTNHMSQNQTLVTAIGLLTSTIHFSENWKLFKKNSDLSKK